jgi:uncharacterized membrane protein YkgB
MSHYVIDQQEPASIELEARVSRRITRRPAAVDTLQRWLNRWSIPLLRISLGLVFLGFGVLKFFPGLSPAADIAAATIDKLTLGLVSGSAAVLLTAVLETFIGLTLVTGKFLELGLIVLAGALVGILSPLVLFTRELFPHGPSLLGQYVLKDFVLAAAGLVVAAVALGSKLEPGHDED